MATAPAGAATRSAPRPMPPIVVLHVITRMILGGAQENTLLTLEGLQRNPRFDARLVTGPALGPEGSLLERARAGGIPVEVVDSLRREIHPLHDLAALAALVRIFRRVRPRIVHTHSAKAGILGRAAAWLTRVPVVIHTVHGLSFHPYQSRWLNRLYVLAERVVAPVTDAFVTVAEAMRDQSLAVGIGTPDRYRTIASGMELEPFFAAAGDRDRVRAELGFSPDEVVFAKVARLFELKGHEYVLAAFRALANDHPRARLLFIGDGIRRAELEAEAEQMGIRARVTFLGLVPPERIPPLLHAADAVVHASLREGLPRVVPQALLCRRPVVAFDVDGAREVVVPGRTGALVPARDVLGLERAMRDVLTDPETARSLAEQGCREVRERFSARGMVLELIRLYDRLSPPEATASEA